jgi:hypothetical protein
MNLWLKAAHTSSLRLFAYPTPSRLPHQYLHSERNRMIPVHSGIQVHAATKASSPAARSTETLLFMKPQLEQLGTELGELRG